jgi:hypothetical protein
MSSFSLHLKEKLIRVQFLSPLSIHHLAQLQNKISNLTDINPSPRTDQTMFKTTLREIALIVMAVAISVELWKTWQLNATIHDENALMMSGMEYVYGSIEGEIIPPNNVIIPTFARHQDLE